MYHALVPGGVFYLDAFLTESLYPAFRARDWNWWGNEGERYRVIEDRTFDLDTSRVNVTWTFQSEQSDKPAHTYPTSIRVYSYRELLALLREAGFQVFSTYDGLSDEPFVLGSKRLKLVAWKRE